MTHAEALSLLLLEFADDVEQNGVESQAVLATLDARPDFRRFWDSLSQPQADRVFYDLANLLRALGAEVADDGARKRKKGAA